jgi:hypothetical protein
VTETQAVILLALVSLIAGLTFGMALSVASICAAVCR